ncbi:PhlD [Streptomyces sp. NPDC047981]|uniref:PhlD n=1 Tax=Streptomyces sp. NPDC047981 TaxID=3154610 RepID=UPI0034143712
MPAYISRPHTAFPAHKVTTSEIVDDILARHPGHPRCSAIPRVIASLRVDSRYFTRPLMSPTVSGDAGIEERSRTAFADALELATTAAQTTLAATGLAPDPGKPGAYADVDAIVTTHSTGWSVPNLDIHLIAALGLRPTVRRIALTTMACAGGTQALIRAVDLVTARPGAKVLVVAAEVISSVYNHNDTSIEAMIYKALFGDSAAACIVSSEPLGPGLRIDGPDDTLEFVLPDSVDRYSGRLDAAGFHFDSTKDALTAADDVLPTVLDWLGPDHTVDFAAVHPGSPRIITDTATALGLDATSTVHSFATLSEEGNLGGVSILRVLERTHTTPPPAGARGVAVAYGPGFNTAAIRGTWAA